MSTPSPFHSLACTLLAAWVGSCVGCGGEGSAEPRADIPPSAPASGHTRPSEQTPSPSAIMNTPRAFSISATEARQHFAEARRRGMPDDGLLLIADTDTQRAVLIDAGAAVLEYAMSSSKFGTGSQADSNQTPLGWHKVVERFGGDQLQGTVFRARRPEKRILKPDEWRGTGGEDLVLTRILWLGGLEPGINQGGRVDSHTRCIYIHGTNQEQLLGQPASHGCLRVSNRDVMELFDRSEGRDLYCLVR